MKYQELTHQIIGLAMKIHSTIGAGFQEVIYQLSLAIELGNAEIMYVRKFEMPIMYEGNPGWYKKG